MYTEKVGKVYVGDWHKIGPMRQERHWEDGTLMDILPDHAWMIQVETPEGRVFNHFYRWDFDGGRDGAELVAKKIRTKGEIDLEYYSETYPNYCSPAGRAAEAEDWMSERQEAGGIW